MTTGELLIAVRSDLDDKVGTDSQKYWGNADLIRYANTVRNRLFVITRKLLIDSTTAEDADELPLCRIPLLLGVTTYAISPKIMAITRLKLASQTEPLTKVTTDELDSTGDWESLPNGDPWGYCIDRNVDSITFVPPPKANDTASLSVYRLPLAKLATNLPDADLGFREEYHDDLLPGIKELAFRKQDSEAYNPALAEEYRRTFLARADEIKVELHKRYAKPHGTGMRRGFGTR